MMVELGWTKQQAKWAGVDYSRALWLKDGYTAHRGKLSGPDSFEADLAEHLTLEDYGLMGDDRS